MVYHLSRHFWECVVACSCNCMPLLKGPACYLVCHKRIELSMSGRSALTDHAKGKKHTEVIDRRKDFSKPKSSTSTMADTSKSSKSAATRDLTLKKDDQCTLDNILCQTNSTNYDIIWILKCVMNSVPVRFNDDIGETFSAMVLDINFKDFYLERVKSVYVINPGLAPYFQTLLIDILGKSGISICSFDESLADSTQTSEMDLYVRYWDDFDKLVKVRYYRSFLIIVRLTISLNILMT